MLNSSGMLYADQELSLPAIVAELSVKSLMSSQSKLGLKQECDKGKQ